MTDAVVEYVAYGPREAMVAEVAAHDMSVDGHMTEAQCAFLVMPVGNAAWDTEQHATLEDAKDAAGHLAEAYRVKAERVY